MTAARHVIFGTGAIGLATCEALRRRGESVRLVNRSGHARVPDDVEVIGGDARDPGFATAVARGAAVVYQTLNPPYPEWTAQFPALQAGVLAARFPSRSPLGVLRLSTPTALRGLARVDRTHPASLVIAPAARSQQNPSRPDDRP